jgi:hypothetical protein
MLAILATMLISFAVAMPFQSIMEERSTTTANKPVYLTFKEITQIIIQLDKAQDSPAPAGAPNFNASAYLLNQLSLKAQEATSLLQQMGDDQLDDESVADICNSLSISAEHVVAITRMVEQGKDWFAQYDVTSKVVQILQLNAYQFSALFTELEKHVPPTVYGEYGRSITNFSCSIINAIEYLDSNACAPEGKQFCDSCQQDQSQYYQSDSYDYTQLAPPGMDSCDYSSSSYLQCAYEQQTLGTQDTTCAYAVISVTFELPQNALCL